MNRRDFLGIAAASIFAPQFGRWYRQGSGLLVRDVEPPQGWVPFSPPRFAAVEHYTITAVTATTITVERFPKPVRVPVGSDGRLRNRALFSDAKTGHRSRPADLHVVSTSDFRVGQVVRIPQPFAQGQLLLP